MLLDDPHWAGMRLLALMAAAAISALARSCGAGGCENVIRGGMENTAFAVLFAAACHAG